MNESISIPGPCVNFKLAVLARLMDETYKEAYKGFDLSTEQVRLLLNLKGIGPCSQRDLAARLHLEKSSFSRAIQSLQEMGIVLVKISKTDAREKKISLTKKGEQKVKNIIPIWKAKHESTLNLIGPKSIKEIDRLIALLKINKNKTT
jgi:DNA-binding MarR family transcriptional regulator